MKKADIEKLTISQYDYHLPDNRVAKYPLDNRDASKLLMYDGNIIDSDGFHSLASHLPANSLLLFNNTRVIHARLIFRKATGAAIEVFCLMPYSPADYTLNFQQRKRCKWICMIGNARRWKDEMLTMDISIGEELVHLLATKENVVDDGVVVDFSWDNEMFTFSELLEAAGKLPIPPYLNRLAEANDDITYQTIYSSVDGSVAAPTAGLHFTPGLMGEIEKKGIKTAEVTLHVGAGTFKPVKSDTMESHEMHTEYFSVSKETIEAILDNSGKLVVVGTTSTRAVESLYYVGKRLMSSNIKNEGLIRVDQWEPYEEISPIEPRRAMEAILRYMSQHGESRLVAATRLMISPGYDFHFPDAIITNFHQPKSTLLLLVSAFVGDDWKKIYRYALDNDFRFLSYGDASLLWKKLK